MFFCKLAFRTVKISGYKNIKKTFRENFIKVKFLSKTLS